MFWALYINFTFIDKKKQWLILMEFMDDKKMLFIYTSINSYKSTETTSPYSLHKAQKSVLE